MIKPQVYKKIFNLQVRELFIISEKISLISENIGDGLALEIGPGSGLVSTAFSKWSKNPVISADINPECAKCTAKMAEINKVSLDSIIDNAAKSLKRNIFDFVLLNPPYVVTTSEELYESQLKRGYFEIIGHII